MAVEVDFNDLWSNHVEDAIKSGDLLGLVKSVTSIEVFSFFLGSQATITIDVITIEVFFPLMKVLRSLKVKLKPFRLDR